MGCCLTYPEGSPLQPYTHDEKKSYAKLSSYGNARICYSLEGDEKAPLVVMIHGIEGGMWVYDKLNAFLLSSGFRTLRFDLFGRGDSDLPPGKHTADYYIEQVEGLLRVLNLSDQRKMVIGHSMGGAISVGFTARYGDNVDRLILLAPAGYVSDISLKCFKCCPCCGDCFFGTATNFFVSNLMKSIYRPKEQIELCRWIKHNIITAINGNPGYLVSVSLSCRDFPLDNMDHEARSIDKRIRVLILWGDKDFEGGWGVPFANHKPYLEAIPHAEFYPLRDLHHLFFLEDPHQTNGLIGNFLEGKKSTPRTERRQSK